MHLHFSIGCYECRRTSRRCQSILFSRIQVLSADHVHRRSGVYNNFSFLKFTIWGRRQAPISRKEKVVLYFSFNFRMLLASFHAASLAPCSCQSVTGRDRSSHLDALGVTLIRITWANYSKRWILVSNVSMTYDGFCEFNTSDWFPCVWALPQNRWRLRRLHILKTRPNCRAVSSTATALLSPFFLIHFARLFYNLAMRIRELFSNSASTLGLVEHAFWRMPLFTEWIGTNSFEVILAWHSKHSSTWGFCFWTAQKSSEKDSAVLCLHAYWYRAGNCNCRLLEDCPLAFHCQQSPGVLCSRCFVPCFLTTAFVS